MTWVSGKLLSCSFCGHQTTIGLWISKSRTIELPSFFPKRESGWCFDGRGPGRLKNQWCFHGRGPGGLHNQWCGDGRGPAGLKNQWCFDGRGPGGLAKPMVI